MPIPITIPRLGWNMEEGTFAGWLKQDGDSIRPGDALYSLESEKATEQIESLDAGVLRLVPDRPKPGAKVAVGAVIGYLVEPGEVLPSRDQSDDARRTAPKNVPAPGTEPSSVRATGSTAAPSSPKIAGVPTISPRARCVADELGIDWTRLEGTGRTGRIRERDVRAAATLAGAPLASIRRTIADRMVASLRATAPVTLTTTADATRLVQLRAQIKAIPATSAESPAGVAEIMVKLAACALQQHPQLNAVWSGERLVVSPQIDIGIAVDTEFGLVVPVIRDVPALSLAQLAQTTRDLIGRARGRQLKTLEMEGGTFTVTNLGSFGIDAFTPIIHYPQCAILGVGQIRRQPAVVEDQVVVRDRVTLSLTFDHRALDGAPAARFLQALVQLIESPDPHLG